MILEEKHRWMYLILGALACRPPSMMKLTNSPLIVTLMIIWAWVPCILSGTQAASIAIFIFLRKPPTKAVLALTRRFYLTLYGALKLFLCILNTEEIQYIFDVYNSDSIMNINPKRREDILEKSLKKQHRFYVYAIVAICLPPGIITFNSITNPYGAWASVLYFPHRTTAPYHMFLVVLENVTNAFACSNVSCDIVRLHILLMLTAQVQTLTNTLSNILQSLPNKATRKENYDVEKKLSAWLRAHQRTIRWSNAIMRLFGPDLSNRYLFMGIYACTGVFSMPGWLKDGNLSSIMLIALYGTGFFSFQFVMTSKIHKLTELSGRIFEKAYGDNWHHLSIRNQKTLKVISLYCSNRRIKFYAFGLYADSIPFYFQILVITYRMLSCVLQIESS